MKEKFLYCPQQITLSAICCGLIHLLEIVEGRVNQSSLIITSQLPVKEWHGYLHNATIADAILDRVVHNAYKIEFKADADSQRKKNAKAAMG